MIAARRLTAVAAFLGLAAVVTSPRVWGEPKRDRELKAYRSNSTTPPPEDRRFAEELAVSRFAEQQFVVYTTAKGESYFALQLRPALEPTPARPRDIAVLVDTSASKAQGPLDLEKRFVAALVEHLGADDRLAIWTLSNEPRSLTGNRFKAKGELTGALKTLAEEYPSGATNLKKGLADAVAAFNGNSSRQGVILFLGDGKSLADPIDADARATVCEEMVKKQVACFTVPFGLQSDALNLHGLPNATGGRCVRIRASGSPSEFLTDFDAALTVPVLYPRSAKFAATEVFPSHLPPLRPDVSTLVVGKLAEGATTLSYHVDGTVADKAAAVDAAPKVPAADIENFFLVGMVGQWREQKDRPALMPADRALAYASERNQLARAELVAKAELALDQGMYVAAEQLYRQASELDPSSVDARSGVDVARRMQRLMEHVVDEQSKLPANKKLAPEQVRAEVRKRFGEEVKIAKADDQAVRPAKNDVVRLAQNGQPPPVAPPGAPPVVPQAAPDKLEDVKARFAIAEQYQRRIVDDAIRTANRLVETDPNGARELLKRTIDGVRNNPDISDRVRASLGDQAERALATVDLRGRLVLRDQEAALKDAAIVAGRLHIGLLEQNAEARIRERMRVIHNLFDQARELEAYKQAEIIREDLVAQGRPVPPAVTAAYSVALAGYHIRQIRDLRRIRQERFLATMLEVERSAIPFPDEPPVAFPPAAEWKALAELRKVRYESGTLGAEVPRRTFEIRDTLARTVKYDGLDDPKSTLQDVLDQLRDKYNLQFDVNEKAFKFENPDQDVLKTEVATPPIPPLTASLGTVLRKILSRIKVNSGATFIIRRDTIEITTGLFATSEKALRTYPVADLVTPIPNSVNVQAVNQAATLFGFAGAVGVNVGVQIGAANAFGIGGLGALGAAGALGALGAVGALGALGAVGVQIGALGALGALGAGGLAVGGVGVQLGALGAVGGVGGLGVANQLGVANGGFGGQFQGAANLGVGGGIAGVGGGQLGQFGNLGGQFGLQGGDQSRILITLIRQVVGRPSDWLPAFNEVTGRPLNQLDEGDPAIVGGENNQVAYYVPARALAVKGTSRIQTRPFSPITVPAGDNKAVDAGRADRGDRLARGKDADRGGVNVAAGAAQAGDRPGKADKANTEKTLAKLGDAADPREIWQHALEQGVNDPGLIIAVGDYLVMNRRFDHAAEFLKANLRQGIVVKPWVYKTLALALRESGGSAAEIERADTAALELEPQNARGYLTAARSMKEDKRYDRAVAFCRQASLLEPNTPWAYSEALLYAELAQDGKAMEWAAGNLVKQEWPVQNKELHEKAALSVKTLRDALEKSDKRDDARHLVDAVQGQKRRDLTIKASWQGEADLDLKVQEPSGSVCSALNRQTVGGGTLVGDTLADMNSETYTAGRAFSGEYLITVERFRGRPLGNRAQLRIIKHQGTPNEVEQLVAVDLTSAAPVKVHLADGRRTEAAYVPPPSAARPDPVDQPTRQDVLADLRRATDPDAAAGFSKGFQAQASSTTAATVAPSPVVSKTPVPAPSPNDRTFYQTKIDSFVKNSLDVTAQAVLSADRTHVRVSLAPLAAPTAAAYRPVVVTDPLIPGGN
jgi:tetratricopeptide (TPR) repeat protein